MKQTNKENRWNFGMRAHVGSDAATGLVHCVAASSTNESDVSHAHELLHGEKALMPADTGYTGADKREEVQHLHGVTWCIALKPGQNKSMPEWRPWREAMKTPEHAKAYSRSTVEDVFRAVKCRFDCRKARYKGLVKDPSPDVQHAGSRKPAACGQMAGREMRIVQRFPERLVADTRQSPDRAAENKVRKSSEEILRQ